MAADQGSPSDEPGASQRARPGAADRDDRPEMVRKLQERKERHKERGKLARVGVVVLGVVLVLVGIVLSGPGVPGPGFAVILVGLAFLALEFDRAERLLERVMIWADQAKDRAERATTREKVAVGVLVALAIAGFVAAAILVDIPFLPF